MRLIIWATATVVLAGLPGCRPKKKVETRPTVEDTAPPAAPVGPTAVSTGDALSAGQLLSGFHEIENNSWRWTERKFAVSLGVPAGAAKAGAILQMRVTVPPVTISKLGSITLTGSVSGTDLASEKWTQPGDYVYRCEVPPALLRANPATIDFRLDQAIPPGKNDQRELGLIVSSVGLEGK